MPDATRFLDNETAPDTVHPSLWRLARLNAIHGLFEVVPGIYQVRGFALANVTFIEGATGLIVVDPLGSVGAARRPRSTSTHTHRPKKPVTTIIYTHSHSDHYGGARGVGGCGRGRSGPHGRHRPGRLHGGRDRRDRSSPATP